MIFSSVYVKKNKYDGLTEKSLQHGTIYFLINL